MITRTARAVYVESNVFMKAVEGGRARHAAASPRTVVSHAIDAPPSNSRLPQPPPLHTPCRPVDGRGRRTGFFFKFSRKIKKKTIYIRTYSVCIGRRRRSFASRESLAHNAIVNVNFSIHVYKYDKLPLWRYIYIRSDAREPDAPRSVFELGTDEKCRGFYEDDYFTKY